MSLSSSFYDTFQKKILPSQPGMWVAIGVLIGISAGVGSLLLYNGIRLVSDVVLYGISGLNLPLPGGEGGSATYNIGNYNRFLIPVSTTLGGFLSGFMVYKLTPGSEGLGINAAINAFHNLSVKIKNRTPAVKLVSSAVNIGAGGSAGRDGPVALISAVFGSFLADAFKLDDHDRRIVMASAIGAGIGSIFMAPIGGAIMSTEILYRRDFEVEALVPATVASLVGYAIFGFQFHYDPLFTTAASSFFFLDGRGILVYAILGLFAGIGGTFYVRVFDWIHLAFLRLRRVPVYVKPAIGGFLVGAIAIFYPEILGLGYGWVQLILSGNFMHMTLKILILLFFLKILASSFSLGSGGSGGVFAPSIVTGAFLGASLGLLLHPIFPFVSVDEITIVTMIAFFGGVSKTPLAMMVMGSEMAGGLDLLFPLMIAVSIAYYTSGVKYTVYSEQVLDRLHSPAHMFEYKDRITDSITVKDAMNSNFVEAVPDTKLLDLLYTLRSGRKPGAVIVENGKPTGYLSRATVQNYSGNPQRTVADVKAMPPRIIKEDETIHRAIEVLPMDSQEDLIVVDGSDGRVEGTMGFVDIANAYEAKFREEKVREMRGESF